LAGLRELTSQSEKAAFQLVESFSSFYLELTAKKSAHAAVEESTKNMLSAWLQLRRSWNS